MNTERLLHRIGTSQLFRSLGTQPKDAGQTITTWEEWPGPEDSSVSEIHFRQQHILDQALSTEQEPHWKSALALVVATVSKLVPYDPGADAWHGPNLAAWHAAWVFCLEELFQTKDVPLPLELIPQIYWFERGHWPCALLSPESRNDTKGYLVF